VSPPSDTQREPRRLILREWVPWVGELTPADAAALARAAPEVLRVEFDRTGATRLVPGSHVGRFRAAGFDLWIEPKVPMMTLLSMLMEVSGLVKLMPTVGVAEGERLEDFIARAFLHEVGGVVRQGLHRLYARHEDQVTVVRGRLDVRKTTSLHSRARPRAHCEFDEFTNDTPENRVLLAALRALAQNEAVSQKWRAHARAMQPEFLGVAEVTPEAEGLVQLGSDPRTRHYQMALRLAALVLRATGFHERHGALRSSGFLVDMNALFETLLTKQLSAALHPLGIEVRGQVRDTLDIDGRVRIRPDLLVQGPDGRRVVVDAKYKVAREPSPADLYQMVAYCRVLGASSAVLVGAGERSYNEVRVRDGTTVYLESMSLATPVDLAGSVQHLASLLERLVT
jgi:5-methylcytosine-specific restriction enzyme subunit McrC